MSAIHVSENCRSLRPHMAALEQQRPSVWQDRTRVQDTSLYRTIQQALTTLAIGIFVASLPMIAGGPGTRAHAQGVGASGCVAYCDGGSSGSGGYTGGGGGLDIGQFFRDLADQRNQRRRERATEENNQCIALGEQREWMEAEALCQSALDLCMRASGDCSVIRDNVAWSRAGADELREDQETRRRVERRMDAVGSDIGRIIEGIAWSDPNVVDLTFLDPNEAIVLDPSRVSGDFEGPPDPNRKTEMLLTALEEGAGDWQISIDYLENHLLERPWDEPARDAYLYLLGMHKGYLARAEWSNLYYRRGVYSWMHGYYDLAAADLATALAANPDDEGTLQLYATIVGIRDGSGYCEREACGFDADRPFDDVSRPPEDLDYEDDPRMQVLRERVGEDPESQRERNLLNYIEGLAVYANYSDPEPSSLEPETAALVAEGYALLEQGENIDAVLKFTDAYWREEDETILFAVHYALGRDSGWQAQQGEEAWRPLDERTLSTIDEFVNIAIEAEFLAGSSTEALLMADRDTIDRLGNEELAFIQQFMVDPLQTIEPPVGPSIAGTGTP